MARKQPQRLNPARLALLFSVVIPLQVFAVEADIERLFFTPEERQRLDHIRHGGSIDAQPDNRVDHTGIETITLNGTLQKRGGGLRAWLNDTALDSADFSIPANVGRQLTSDGGLPLQLPGGLAATPRVGQQVNLRSGAVSESYLHTDNSTMTQTIAGSDESNQLVEEPEQ